MNVFTWAIAVAIATGLSLSSRSVLAAPPDVDAGPPTAAPDSPARSSPETAGPPASGPAPASTPPAPSPTDESTTLQTESPPAPMGAAPPSAKPLLPEWMNGVTLGAGVLLWYYQPIAPRAPNVENNVSVFWARLLADGKWGPFGFHLEPRFRDSPLRSTSGTLPSGASVLTYTQNDHAWLQEAYASLDIEPIHGVLKLGKEYSRLGYFWDGSFYGNVQVYDGLKLDPDYGASLEGDVGSASSPFGLGYSAQYFIVDGSTNVSLPGRDTISVPGARRRNQTIVRLEPRLKVGGLTAALGVSGEYLQADLPTLGPQDVLRGALDATVTFGGAKILGELQHQDGRTVTDFPLVTSAAGPGSSKNIDYAQIGGEYTYGPVTARYYASLGSYNDIPTATGPVTVKEWLHVIGLGVAVSSNISLLGELVFWEHDMPSSSSLVDRSFNLTLGAHL